jgi:hypothetical protein
MSFMDREKDRKAKAADEIAAERLRTSQGAGRFGFNWRVNDQEHAPETVHEQNNRQVASGQVLSARGFVELYHGPVDRSKVPRSMLRRPRWSLT